jgi:DNA-directed RNA polymerase specialized sigma24 family protein
MSAPQSVSCWLEGLKGGDFQAARALWQRYSERLVALARRKLRHTSRRVADEEDIALSAFHSLCQGARNGRFPDLEDRDNLWGLLVFISAQKAADWIDHEHRQKRGGGRVRGHSALGGNADPSGGDFDRFLAKAPGPETLHVWRSEYEQLLNRLGDDTLRRIAVLRVQGYTVDEIAAQLDVARRTVHRKLDLIRKILSAGENRGHDS